MKHNFSFNSGKYDLWPIYEAIKSYYPIGITRGDEVGIYFEYPGIEELEKIVVDNIHDRKTLTKRWSNFTKAIGEEIGLEIVGTTYGQAPSFSSSLILQKNQTGTCLHNKELHFTVSLIGPFFQIYGLDSTWITQQDGHTAYPSGNVVTASPIDEYKEIFEFVEDKIRSQFTDYRFVPFGIGQNTITGLQVRYLDDKDCTIYQALFNHLLNDIYVTRFTKGNQYYGMKDWKKS